MLTFWPKFSSDNFTTGFSNRKPVELNSIENGLHKGTFVQQHLERYPDAGAKVAQWYSTSPPTP